MAFRPLWCQGIRWSARSFLRFTPLSPCAGLFSTPGRFALSAAAAVLCHAAWHALRNQVGTMACAAWNGGSDRSVLELTSILGHQKASRRWIFCIFVKKERKMESFVFFLYLIRGIHTTLSLHTANLAIVVHVFQTLGFFLPTFVYAGEDLSVRNQNLEGLLDDVLAKNQLSRTTELPQWSDLLQLCRQNMFFSMMAFQ